MNRYDQELADVIEAEHLRRKYTPKPRKKRLRNLAPYPPPLERRTPAAGKRICPWCGRKRTGCHSDLDPILNDYYAGRL